MLLSTGSVPLDADAERRTWDTCSWTGSLERIWLSGIQRAGWLVRGSRLGLRNVWSRTLGQVEWVPLSVNEDPLGFELTDDEESQVSVLDRSALGGGWRSRRFS